jgi:putative FmdB family regulatory protein
MPIYEYRCPECGKRSSALLPRWDAPDPPCRHCGSKRVQRLVSTFATQRSGEDDFGSDFDGGDGGDDGGFGGDDDDF